MNSLSNAVVFIIDETGNSTLAKERVLEDQLIALGEKWAHVCRFVEEHGAVLELVARNWKVFEDEEDKFNNWITKLDKFLSEMEEGAAQPDTSSQIIAELIKRLQLIETEMEDQRVYCSKIADEGQKLLQHLDGSPTAASVIETKLKKLVDTWDHTVQRMENLCVALTQASAMAAAAEEKRERKRERKTSREGNSAKTGVEAKKANRVENGHRDESEADAAVTVASEKIAHEEAGNREPSTESVVSPEVRR